MNGTNRLGKAFLTPNQVAPAWKVVGMEDLDGNGKPDIIWRNDNGTMAYWLMNGTVRTNLASWNPGSASTTWSRTGCP